MPEQPAQQSGRTWPDLLVMDIGLPLALLGLVLGVVALLRG